MRLRFITLPAHPGTQSCSAAFFRATVYVISWDKEMEDRRVPYVGDKGRGRLLVGTGLGIKHRILSFLSSQMSLFLLPFPVQRIP